MHDFPALMRLAVRSSPRKGGDDAKIARTIPCGLWRTPCQGICIPQVGARQGLGFRAAVALVGDPDAGEGEQGSL